MKAIVFLGGGRNTGALAAGWRLAGNRQTIVVYDRHPEKLRALRRESRVEMARDLKSAVERAQMLIIAVRPASVMRMLEEVANCGAPPPKLCTDNVAMVDALGALLVERDVEPSALDLPADSSMALT